MDVTVRPLAAADLAAVVALDASIGGTPRSGYFAKRLQAALRQPRRHLQLALDDGGFARDGRRPQAGADDARRPQAGDDGGLAGFLLARKAGGEYGDVENALVVEAFGVAEKSRHRGAGRRLLRRLEELARERGISLLLTQALWRDHGILRFLDSAHFEVASRRILELAVQRLPVEDTDVAPPLVRQLGPRDLDALVEIDERITGKDRRDYLGPKIEEVLYESAIQVSLVAEDDGFPVGFAMARVDFGDFGRIVATATLDTIGVDPRFAGHGFGRALLAQMIENLAALHVERLETEVDPEAFDLSRFLLRSGFAPSQRIAFRKALT
ncbi:MAG: GNAT family N-acetyltransferase [Myxococcales bacterium]